MNTSGFNTSGSSKPSYGFIESFQCQRKMLTPFYRSLLMYYWDWCHVFSVTLFLDSASCSTSVLLYPWRDPGTTLRCHWGVSALVCVLGGCCSASCSLYSSLISHCMLEYGGLYTFYITGIYLTGIIISCRKSHLSVKCETYLLGDTSTWNIHRLYLTILE